jgi:LCP family protein required for cell wall assembly
MISIPRDLGVTIPNQGVRKINYAGAYGEAQSPGQGGEFARQVFEKTFDQPIPYYIRVDFKAFTDMIDTVGGVQVNVPTTFTDTQFPGENFSFRTVRFEAGPQTMNGETALTFARSRHGNNGEGGDFARARRQQLVILSLKQKLLSAGTYTNPLTIQQILSSLKAHVTTNLSITELTSLARMASEFNSSPKNLVLDNSPAGFLVSTTGESGAFLLFPKTGDYTNVNTAIAGIFSSTSTPSLAVTPALIYPKPATSTPGTVVYSNFKVELQNGTWRVGLADTVEIINASKVDLTLKKKTDDTFVTYTGFRGGLKSESLGELINRRGMTEVFRRAVGRMIPRNRLHDDRIKNLIVKE